MNAGDIAVFIKCPSQPLNIGLIVELVAFTTEYGPPLWLVKGNVKPVAGAKPLPEEEPYGFTYARADWLRVIGNPVDADVDEVLQRIPSPFTTQPERTEA